MRIWPLAVLRGHSERRARLDERARAAAQEKELSQERLERVRKDIAEPAAAYGRHNRFAEMIRKSLLEGYER